MSKALYGYEFDAVMRNCEAEVTYIDAAAPPWRPESLAATVAVVVCTSAVDAPATCVDGNSRPWIHDAVEELLIS